jgi:vancomycin resistance protein YoaR
MNTTNLSNQIRVTVAVSGFSYSKVLLFVGLVATGFLISGGSLAFKKHYQGRIYPGIKIDDIELGGLSQENATNLLQQHQTVPNPIFKLTHPVVTAETTTEVSVASTAAELGIARDNDAALAAAFGTGRSSSWLNNTATIAKLLVKPHSYRSTLKLNADKVTDFITSLNVQVAIPGRAPAAILGQSGVSSSLKIDPGLIGSSLDATAAATAITNTLVTAEATNAYPSDNQFVIPTTTISQGFELLPSEQTDALERAKKLVNEELEFTADNIAVRLEDQALVDILAFPTGYNQEVLTEVVKAWSDKIQRPPQDAVFKYDPNTLVVSEFVPHRDGLTLDPVKAAETITNQLSQLENKRSQTPVDTTDLQPISLPITSVQPKQTLASTNNLGIKEKIGIGLSEYEHSIPTRIHNVSVTAAKTTNIILKPGEEFSFNKALGEVSQATGFKPAYVIKNGKTELGDGGGVCQVSTTLFRAVLNAGLPVTKRKAHSYRVSYYELNAKPGIDATVYEGEVDLRFRNDTNHAILIHHEVDSEQLHMQTELYGTSDGRTTEIVDHKMWDYRAPLPTQYIPDPSLPHGVRRQIDWSVSGVKASFKNIVKDKNGNVIREEEYYSNYQPWSAKYLVGV